MIDVKTASEEEVRRAIVAEVVSWEGTPYHHEAKVKNHGVDCAQLPNIVYSEVGLIDYFEPPHYPHDWMMNNSHELYMEFVERFGVLRPDGEAAKPGDFVLWEYGLCYAHGMIVLDWPLCMHAQWRSKVERIDVSVDQRFAKRRRRVYTWQGFAR